METKFSTAQNLGIALFALLISTFWSCKENTILPNDLVPTIDNITTFDSTFDLITHTLYQDSFLTGGSKSGLRLSSTANFYMACGTILSDPAFGKTVASMHVELLPAVPNFIFKAVADSIIIDSVVLSIPYKTSFGDTTATTQIQTFKVHRSLETFSRDSTQYEFTKDVYSPGEVLSTLNVDFNTLSTDSPLVGTVKQQPQLRFKLASWFADSLKKQVSLGSLGALSSFSNYLSWWKGFAIVPDSSTGNTLGYFDTYKTRMYIYYRYNKVGGGQDTTSDVFSFDPNYCNRFNTITHNYSGKQAAGFINTQSPLGDSLLFVQNEPGLVNVIKMPTITGMENVIVNKAELVFTTAASQSFIDTNTYGLIPRLQIFRTDSNGNNDLVAEDYAAFGSANYVDGKRYQTVINGITYVQYKFTVTYSIQKMISLKNSDFRFKIMGASTGLPASYRAILSGSGSLSTDFKPRLYVVYTKINK